MEVMGINHLVRDIVTSNISSISIDSGIYKSFLKYIKSKNLADTTKTILQEGIQLNLDSEELTKKIAKLCLLTIHPVVQNDILTYSIDDFIEREVGHISYDDFRAFIEKLDDINSKIHQKFLDEVIPTYTQFFRYPELFEFVDEVIVHNLASKNQGNIKALSLGCSLGCEVYSLAVLLFKNPAVFDYEITGVDINQEAIKTAKAGIYSSSNQFDFGPVINGLTETQKGILFKNKPRRYHIKDALKKKTKFYAGDIRAADLLQSLGTYDLIIEQNSLGKYGETAHQQHIFYIISHILNYGGFLITDATMPSEEIQGNGLYEIWIGSGIDKITTGLEYKRVFIIGKGSKTILPSKWDEARIPLEHKVKYALLNYGLDQSKFYDYLDMFKGNETFHQVNKVIGLAINSVK